MLLALLTFTPKFVSPDVLVFTGMLPKLCVTEENVRFGADVTVTTVVFEDALYVLATPP